MQHSNPASIVPASILLVLMGSTSAAAGLGSRMVPWEAHTGIHSGFGNDHQLVYEAEILVPDAPSLRLTFEDVELGASSFLLMTSTYDGASQVLDATSIEHYAMRSAGFNGERVLLELWAAPEDTGVFVELREVEAGERADPSQLQGAADLWCGDGSGGVTFDDRVARMGGVVIDGGCTAWRVTNGAIVTAGHCGAADGLIIEFIVPSSLSDGTPQWAHPDDQYAIDGTTVEAINDQSIGPGKDFAVFGVHPNANTGLLPEELYLQRGFRMTRDFAGGTTRVYGYGFDMSPPGSTGLFNSNHRVLQIESADYNREDNDGPWYWHEYDISTQLATSGGPIVWGGFDVAIGVNTHGGCGSSDALGASFETNDFEAMVDDFPGPVVRYVDAGHPAAAILGDGSVLRPFDAIVEGSNAMPAGGGLLSIVDGSYGVGTGIVLDRELVTHVPFGTVVIGE